METLPKRTAKLIQIKADADRLILRRPPKTQWLNLVSGLVCFWWAYWWASIGVRTHQNVTVGLGIVFGLLDLLLVVTTLFGFTLRLVFDRTVDTITDGKKSIGKLSELTHIGSVQKSGIVRVVARFADGREAQFSSPLLAFTKAEDAEPIIRILQEFAGLSKLVQAAAAQPWSLTS